MNEITYLRDEELDLSSYYVKTFLWMFMGLLVTAISSIITAFMGNAFLTPTVVIILAVATIIIAMIFTSLFERVSSIVAAIMYFGIAILYGMLFSSIFFVYKLGTIAFCFVISAGLFGIMALYGYITKRDLSKWGVFLTIALLASIIALVVNMFIGSTVFETLICIAVIIIIMLVTAWDINSAKDKKFRNLRNSHIYFALALYLDFITIFIYLLRLIGINIKNK